MADHEPQISQLIECPKLLITDILNVFEYLILRCIVEQAEFYNKATFALSRASVVEKVARFSTNTIGNSNYDVIKAGFTDYKTDQATRFSFKVTYP